MPPARDLEQRVAPTKKDFGKDVQQQVDLRLDVAEIEQVVAQQLRGELGARAGSHLLPVVAERAELEHAKAELGGAGIDAESGGEFFPEAARGRDRESLEMRRRSMPTNKPVWKTWAHRGARLAAQLFLADFHGPDDEVGGVGPRGRDDERGRGLRAGTA